jgi:hypothetical protein
MKKNKPTNRFENNSVHAKNKPVRRFLRQAYFETIFLLTISIGIVISGILVFPTSIGIGLCLVFLGPAVSSEV